MAAAEVHRRILVACALALYAAIFGAFLVWERPGLGIAHFFYVAIAVLALASGPKMGVLGGILATVLYALGVALNPSIQPTELPTESTLLRLITYTAIGLLIGWYAARNRALLAELRVLAERDFLTGLPNTRAFEAAITRRLEAGAPFALLIGDMDRLKAINDEHGHSAGNDTLRRLADVLGGALGGEDEVARVGGDEFAVLTPARSSVEAGRRAGQLETALARSGIAITFGWSVSPQEGINALSLYRAADERLYARKLVRGGGRGDVAARLVALSPPAEAAVP
jgi:diguanylate cyclase (GGDEF)-like protein